MPNNSSLPCNVDVYRIYWTDSDDSYVGSTDNIKRRMTRHKRELSSPNMKVSKKIKEKGGSFEYEILETLWCEELSDGLKRERWWQDELDPSLNELRAFITEEDRKEWVENYKPRKKEYNAEYHQKNKVKRNEQSAQWQKKNPTYNHEYRQKNKERINDRDAEYREKNKDRIAARRRERVVCECGAEVGRGQLARHRKSKKHRDGMN